MPESDEVVLRGPVPGGSVVAVSVKPKDASYTVVAVFAEVSGSSSASEIWMDASIRPGPRSQTLSANKGHSIRLQFAFLKKSEAVAKVTFRDPGGQAVAPPVEWQVTGVKGEKPARVVLFATSA
jgi:hypothetical protein